MTTKPPCSPRICEPASAGSDPPSGDLAALLASEDPELSGFWQQVVNTMNEGLLLVGPDRRIVYLNAKGEQLVGRKLDDVRGALCVDAINCPQCQCCCRLFEEGRAEGVEVTVFDTTTKRARVLRKNGRLLRGPNGELLGGVETFTDISQEVRQRHESERYTSMLFEQKTRIDALLGAMEDGVFSIDGDFKVRTFAPRMSELLGVSEKEALGQPLQELLAVTDDCFDCGSVTDLDGRTFRVSLRVANGSELPTDLSFRRVRAGDEEMLGILRIHDSGSRGEADTNEEFHGIISRSPQMRDIFRLLESAAHSSANILIEGESGVGKELVARAIHRLSLRRAEPFYAVNCATFAGSLLLSELFGHERGAFTGAFRTTKGKLELAGAGTLFLDEVSEIPLHYQAVLLRVLEERNYERVGGQQKLEMRARIIAATNERLADAVRTRRFREDLFFRLKVVPIHVPPLRQRREDIPLLANYFANHPAVNLTGKRIRFTDEALAILDRYRWPGNVRELRNLVEYLCFVAGDVIDVSHLPPELRAPSAQSHHPVEPVALSDASTSKDEKAEVLAALQQARFRRTEAARLLGIDRTTLWRKMKRLGIE
jgi:two-component system, NtrC family, response regulator AtoC